MKKALLKVLLTVAMVCGIMSLAGGNAWAMRCVLNNPISPFNCISYRPDYPPAGYGPVGGKDCTGPAGPKEINIYSYHSGTGGAQTYCVTFEAGNYMLLTAADGWFNYCNVLTIEMGSAATGQVYSGANWGGVISYMTGGQYFTYTSASGFQGLWNTTAP